MFFEAVLRNICTTMAQSHMLATTHKHCGHNDTESFSSCQLFDFFTQLTHFNDCKQEQRSKSVFFFT